MATKLTENEFYFILGLLQSGMKNKEIIDKTKRGHATISRVKQTVTWEKYREYITHMHDKQEPEQIDIDEICEPFGDAKANAEKLFAVEEASRDYPKYFEASSDEKIWRHYNSILLHMIEIGRILNEKHSAI